MKQGYKLAELIKDFQDVFIQGDPNSVIEGVCTIQDSVPGCITFLTDSLYKKCLSTTTAAAVILSPEDAKDCPVNAVISKDPYYTYAKIAMFFDDKPKPSTGIHTTVVMGQHCDIDPSVSIGAYTVIGDHVKLSSGVVIGPHCVISDNTEIDEGSRLDAHVTLYHRTKLGKRVYVCSGTVIGSDGFGYANQKGRWHKVPQLGRVLIEDGVEIGANCAIDRGAIEDTIIKKGVILDNHIQVGHNVRIGEHTAIAALVGISGSTEIGKHCLIGGQTGFAGHIRVTDRVIITGGSGVTNSISESGIYSSGMLGVQTNREWKKNQARIRRINKLMDRVKALEMKINETAKREF